MDDCLNKTQGIMKIFVCCCLSGTTFWSLLPIVYQERSLPLPCWYPFDYKSPHIYPAVYFLQIISQFQLSATFAFSTTYFVVLCFLLSGQFDVLNCSLKNIVATSYIYMGASKDELRKLKEEQLLADEVVNQYFIGKEFNLDLDCIPHLMTSDTQKVKTYREAFNRALAPCVHQQRFILKTLRKVENLFSGLWFLKTLEATLAICTIAFDVVKSSNEKSFLQVFSLGEYLFLVLWEMFMICYCGEIIYENSQRCGEALLRNPWYLHSSEVRNDLLIFLVNAQRSFILTGAKLYPLRLEKFRQECPVEILAGKPILIEPGA